MRVCLVSQPWIKILWGVVIWFVGGLWGGGCSQPTAPGSAVIGAAGGKVTSADGKLTLEIPSGALSADTTISLTLAPPVTGQLLTLPLAYTMKPDGLTFAKPVLASLQLTTTELPQIDLTREHPTVFLYTKSGNTIEALKEIGVDFQPEEGKVLVSGQLSHFSDLRVALGPYNFVIENIDKDITMQVGEVRSFSVYAQQRLRIPQGITALLKINRLEVVAITNFVEVEAGQGGVLRIARELGPPLRGSKHPQPYNYTIGNVLKLTDASLGAKFPADPNLTIECLLPGRGELRVTVDLEENLFRGGELISDANDQIWSSSEFGYVSRAGGTGAFRFKLTCVKPKKELTAPSDGTVSQVRRLKRRANGDIGVSGKEGVAIHDGETLKRKGVVHIGEDVLDEAGEELEGDAEDSAILETEPTPNNTPPTGKLVPTLKKLDGTEKPLKLEKTAQETSFTEIKPICPAEEGKPCKPTSFSLVDKDGNLFRLDLSPPTLDTRLFVMIPASTSKIATAEIRQTTTGYQGFAVARDTGKVMTVESTANQPSTTQEVGTAKPGNHLLRCDKALSRCAVGNTETSEIMVFGIQLDTRTWKQRFSQKLTDAFTSLDLLKQGQGETSVLVTHPNKNGLTRIDLDKEGQTTQVKFIQTECSALRVAVFTKNATHYVAACQEADRSVLIRRDFTNQPPQEPITPPQENTTSLEDTSGQESTTSDGGTSDTPVSSEQEPTPDTQVDCSKYRFTEAGKTYPTWYAGEITGSICAAMYDKLYGRNGQDIHCKTDADCKNPCRYMCCGSALRLELIVCKEGMCQLEYSNKCNFCADANVSPQSCGLPPGYNP